MPTSSTDLNLDDVILSAEADQSDLNNVGRANELAIGLDEDFEDSDEESGSEISETDITPSGVTIATK